MSNNRIISKQDAEILHAAQKILTRLEFEKRCRCNDIDNCSDAVKRENARRKYKYFYDACGKHNVCSYGRSMVLMSDDIVTYGGDISVFTRH